MLYLIIISMKNYVNLIKKLVDGNVDIADAAKMEAEIQRKMSKLDPIRHKKALEGYEVDLGMLKVHKERFR